MSGLFGDDELKNEPLHDKTQSVFKPRALTSMALATNLK